MDFIKYVEREKEKQRILNIEEVRIDINENWVLEKIENYINRFPMFDKSYIINAILTNDLVASFFAKDPSKQNISEKLALEVLKVDKLPAQGRNCIRFNSQGDIVSSSSGNTKSADFILGEYYATQKYTMEAGGAQDNQKNDVIDFLTRGSIKYKVAAVVDGKYWDVHRSELINLFKDNPNVFITSITELTKGE